MPSDDACHGGTPNIAVTRITRAAARAGWASVVFSHFDAAATAPAAMVHHLLTVAPADLAAVVTLLAGGKNRSLIFTRTRRSAKRLARHLAAAQIPAAELHGDLGQGARERNLASFASGAARVMVATDIAARGIHVDGIDLVIHADPPAEYKAYLHRSGRTARAGASGVVITLQTPPQAGDVRALMRKANVAPLTARAHPGSPLLRSIVGEPAAPATLPAAELTTVAAPATGPAAAAMSARYRARRKALTPEHSRPARHAASQHGASPVPSNKAAIVGPYCHLPASSHRLRSDGLPTCENQQPRTDR